MAHFRITAALLAATGLVIAAPAHAQSDSQIIAELKAQVEALTQRVNDLEHVRAPTSPTSPASTAAPRAAPAAPAIASGALATPGSINAKTASAVVSRAVPAAPIDRPLQKGSAAQLSASSDSGEVAIRISTTIDDSTLDPDGTGDGTTSTLSLTASAPAGEGNRTDIGTLGGFANSAMLKLRWSRFTVPIRIPRLSRDPKIRDSWTRIVGIARENCITEAKKKQDAVAAETCKTEVNDESVALYDPEDADAFDALYFPGPSFAYGLEGSVGYHKLSYFDGATLEEKSVEKVPLGAKGFVTWFPNASLTSLTASFEYQHDYEDQESAILCPVATTAPVHCISGPIGSPNAKNNLLGAIELRKQFDLTGAWIPSFGIAPQVTYDFVHKKGAFDLPIYLVPDDEGNLLGGVRFGYRTDSREVIVGVFVGSAFSFHP